MDPRRADRPLTVLTIAPWTARARPDVLVNAFVKAFGASRDVKLVYATSGPEPPEEPTAGNVETRWLPWISAAERAELYRDADVFVSLSGAETWALYFLEAVETGLPIVATRSGALLPYLEDEAFYPVPAPADPDAVAVALRSIARSPESAEYRALAGRERMQSLGFTRSSLTRLGAAIEEHGRPEPSRFPAGADPGAGPLADRRQIRRPDRVGGASAQAAARLATLATAQLHLRADVENCGARIRELEDEISRLRRELANDGRRARGATDWLRRVGRRAFRPLLEG